MNNKKIVVTGAAGYIGRHVVKRLLDAGNAVIATDMVTDNIDPRAEIIQCDIFSGDTDLFTKLMSPDVCLHLAWRDGFVHNSDAHMLNLHHHYTFIKNMVGGGLQHLAVMGTMHEVGYYEGAIDENTPCNPINMYGIAKDALRRACFLMLQDKPVVLQWLRAFYIHGDDEKNHSILSKIIQAEKEGKESFPFTSGKNKYDFIHVSQLADQISACISQTGINGIINCCSGIPLSLADFTEKFIRDNGFKIRLNYGAYPDRTYDSPAVWGDSSKIHSILQNAE